MSFADFDRYCDENDVPLTGVATAEAFGRWLAEETGEVVIGGPVGEAPTFVAIPDVAQLAARSSDGDQT